MNASIQIPNLSETELIARACDYYNRTPKYSRQHQYSWSKEQCLGFGYGKAPNVETATPQCGRKFLNRICVNFLRRTNRDYFRLIGEVAGKRGAPAMRLELACQMFSAIADAYPQLADDCNIQRRGFAEFDWGTSTVYEPEFKFARQGKSDAAVTPVVVATAAPVDTEKPASFWQSFLVWCFGSQWGGTTKMNSDECGTP